MPYSKQTVLTGDTITADWGNYIQTQYDEILSEMLGQTGLLSGDGADGDFNPQSSTTLSPVITNGPLIKRYKSINIPSGVTVTLNPCAGAFIFCQGDCTIAGTLDGTGKGMPLLFPVQSLPPYIQAALVRAGFGQLLGGGGGGGGGQSSGGSASGAFGGSGGAGNTTPYNVAVPGGGPGLAGATWDYAVAPCLYRITGANGGTFGGTCVYNTTPICVGGSGGGGSPFGGGGGGQSVRRTSAGTWELLAGGSGGAAIYLFVGGNVNISGSIVCCGQNGTGTPSSGYSYGGGSGGGGGGIIAIAHVGSWSLSGSLNVNGGSGSTGYQWGNGGAGAIGIATHRQVT